MPKARDVSPTCAATAAKAPEDENSVLESIRLKPELGVALNHIYAAGRKKQQALWEECAKELGCSVEILKKTWLTARKNGETKKAKEPGETRPRSARSSSIEPRETRRSLRSQSIDKMSTTSTTVLESTDNSCASSVCGSPRSEDKRQQQQQQQRTSCRNLCAITEDDINLEAKEAASTADSSQQREKARIDDSAGPSRESVSATDNQSQQTTNDAREVEAHIPPSAASSALTRYLESTVVNEAKPVRTTRFSEPVQTPRNSQAALTGLSSTSRRLPNSSSKTAKMRMQNPDDSTRMFFESIGLTVMSFPQHLQASVKSQVSNIVHELEYELCSPLTEKSVTTVSVGS